MIARRHPLLALLLTGTLLVLQTASSWLHSGCQHDHSAAQTGAHVHHGHCQHGQATGDSEVAVRQGHEQASSDDCAACRYLMLSSLAVEARESIVVEQVARVAAGPPIGVVSSEPVGLYRSRAPPALS